MLNLGQTTLGKLVASVRSLLNQPNAGNSFWSDAEIIDYIGKGIKLYFAEVVTINEGYFTKTVDLSIVSGQRVIPLPPDFFKVKILYILVGDIYVPLSYRNNLSEGYTVSGANTDRRAHV